MIVSGVVHVTTGPSLPARIVTATLSRLLRYRWESWDPEILKRTRRRVAWWDFATGILHAGRHYRFRSKRVHLGGVDAYRVHWVPRLRSGPLPGTLLYLNGGGFILRATNSHARLAADICRRAGLGRAYLPLYRLAPEHKAPAALDDVVAVYRALLDKGYRPRDIVIAGESAGGGLVLCTLLRLRVESLPLPAAAVLLSPVTDLTISGKSHRINRAFDPVLGGAPLAGFDYYHGAQGERDPLVSPLFGEFDGFPPLFVQVGSHERLLDDNLRLQANARRAGCPLTIEVWNRMPHCWQLLPLPERRAAIRHIATFIRHAQAFAPGAPPPRRVR